MVVITLALDTPKLTPVVTAWEKCPTEPEPAPDEVWQQEQATLGQGKGEVCGVAGKTECARSLVCLETILFPCLSAARVRFAILTATHARGTSQVQHFWNATN